MVPTVSYCHLLVVVIGSDAMLRFFHDITVTGYCGCFWLSEIHHGVTFEPICGSGPSS